MQEFNLKEKSEVRNIIIGKLQRMLSSSHINLLLGSAFSLPYLKVLSDIESKLTEAIESGDSDKEYDVKKSFFEGSIYPISLTDFNSEDFSLKMQLVKIISDIINLREASVVHKIINMFTTNYDNFIEMALEKNHIDYFDGFGGRISPVFSTSNFGKMICKQAELTGRTTETISVNLFKLHGSIYWKQQKGQIVFDNYVERFKKIQASTDKDAFLSNYQELCIVNPEKNKFNSTVMNSNYYDQIRMFANELERQNSIIITFGFSFADEHILQVIQRALQSNPTLTILLFPYKQDDLIRFKKYFEYNNNAFCYYNKDETSVEIENFAINDLNSLLMEIYNGIK